MKITLSILCALSILACVPSKSTTSTTNMDKAQFIFRGTVEQVQAANLPEITDVSNTIIVKVNEVVYAPSGFEDWTNKLITVSTKKTNEIKPQSRRLFYTNGWLYGKSLAVVEVGDGNPKDLTNEEVMAGVKNHQDNDVQERLKEASIVVSGTIKEIKIIEGNRRDSEHNPQWATVVLEVDNFLKGGSNETTLSFNYPTSDDVMWENAPNFDQGEKGIWLLKRSDVLKGELVISDKRDFYSSDDLKYITSLLK